MTNQSNPDNRNQNQNEPKKDHANHGNEEAQKKHGINPKDEKDGERAKEQHKGTTITTPVGQAQRPQDKADLASESKGKK